MDGCGNRLSLSDLKKINWKLHEVFVFLTIHIKNRWYGFGILRVIVSRF